LYVLGGKGIEPVDRNHVWHLEFAAQEHGRMPTRQGAMGVDQINFMRLMQLPNLGNDSGKKKCPCERQPDISGQRDVTHSGSGNAMWGGQKLLAIERRDRENRACNANFRQLCERFGDEATSCIVFFAGVERRERQDLQRRSLRFARDRFEHTQLRVLTHN
jgi:hypothetical protein